MSINNKKLLYRLKARLIAAAAAISPAAAQEAAVPESDTVAIRQEQMMTDEDSKQYLNVFYNNYGDEIIKLRLCFSEEDWDTGILPPDETVLPKIPDGMPKVLVDTVYVSAQKNPETGAFGDYDYYSEKRLTYGEFAAFDIDGNQIIINHFMAADGNSELQDSLDVQKNNPYQRATAVPHESAHAEKRLKVAQLLHRHPELCKRGIKERYLEEKANELQANISALLDARERFIASGDARVFTARFDYYRKAVENGSIVPSAENISEAELKLIANGTAEMWKAYEPQYLSQIKRALGDAIRENVPADLMPAPQNHAKILSVFMSKKINGQEYDLSQYLDQQLDVTGEDNKLFVERCGNAVDLVYRLSRLPVKKAARIIESHGGKNGHLITQCDLQEISKDINRNALSLSSKIFAESKDR